MKISGTVTVEAGSNATGDEQRFIVNEITQVVVIPRSLKERRAELVLEIADIDDALAKLAAAATA